MQSTAYDLRSSDWSSDVSSSDLAAVGALRRQFAQSFLRFAEPPAHDSDHVEREPRMALHQREEVGGILTQLDRIYDRGRVGRIEPVGQDGHAAADIPRDEEAAEESHTVRARLGCARPRTQEKKGTDGKIH